MKTQAPSNLTINSSESEAQQIPPDSGRSGIGSGLSPGTVQAGTESTNYQRDSLNKVKLPNEYKLLESKTGIKREDQSMFS